jgi:sugar phosphate isomerase/epimerase
MKIAYAFRRGAFHPHQEIDLLTDSADRQKYLAKVKEIGFDGIELGVSGGSDADIDTLRRQLEDAGTPCVAIRGGGANRERLEATVRFTAKIGAGVVNSTVTTPPSDPNAKGTFRGENVSQGASRTASAEDYERTAKVISDVAPVAADLGVAISIEIHQNSIADNSESALRLLDLIDQPNVGVNPDLGNIYWTYDVPEESCEDAIVALAPRSNYWHCKNLFRVNIPELEFSAFLQAPLCDGEIDYRFSLSAMLAAGYDGYLAIEGIRLGDQFYNDGKSVAYVKSVVAELGG